MKTIKEKYNAVLEGKYSKAQFVRDAKRELPTIISQYNQFNDTVQILKSKAILSEAKKEEYVAVTPNYSLDALERGIDFELEKAGIDSAGTVSKEDRDKAEKTAKTNLEKDAMHYLNIIAGESSKVDKHDKHVEFKKGKEVDTFNGMKKAELKEEVIDEALVSALDKIGKEIYGKFLKAGAFKVKAVTSNPGRLQQYMNPVMKDPSLVAIVGDRTQLDVYTHLDNLRLVQDIIDDFDIKDSREEAGDRGVYTALPDAEKVVAANGIVQVKLRSGDKVVGEEMYIDDDEFEDEMIKAEIPRVKAALKKDDNPYADDDEMVYDFVKTHRQDFPSHYSPNYDQAVIDEFEQFFTANYEYGSDLGERVAKTVDDVIDPADYGMIGQGYLKGFNRPHSLDLDQLETLGRKVVKSLYKGDFEKAKAKFVDEGLLDFISKAKANIKGKAAGVKQGISNLKKAATSGDATPINPKAKAGLTKLGSLAGDAINRLKGIQSSMAKLFPPADMKKFSPEVQQALKSYYGVIIKAIEGSTEMSKAAGELKEQMSDQEMEDIKNYGQEEKETKVYQLGDMWSKDFDYDGMLRAGLKLRISTPLDTMKKVYSSFEDVNYHSENGHLGNAIDYIEDRDKPGALKHLKLFRDAIRKTLSDINEGHCNTERKDETKGAPKGHYFTKSGNLVKGRLTKDAREKGARLSDPKDKQRSKIPPVTQYNKQEAVVNESRGAFDMCVRAIQDVAEDGDISEREAAMEMMIAIADKYDFDMAGLESQLFYGDDSINEGRRAKSKGGKVVTEMDYDTGGYVEAMGPMFERACKMLMMAWEEWKNGPMTEPGMIEHAKKDVINYLDKKLEEDILQEKKGKDHDGDGDVDSDDYMAARDKAIKKAMGKEKVVKENIKSIIKKVLEEGVVNEAATNALAEFSDTYGGYEGMKQAIIALQDVVTDIESYYDKTRNKIQKVYDTLGDIRNEEGLKVGGFLAPAIEQAFNKDLRPAIKGGFTKGLDQPKVKMISKRDIDMHNSGERPLGEEEKQTVYSRPTVNGTLQETKKNKK